MVKKKEKAKAKSVVKSPAKSPKVQLVAKPDPNKNQKVTNPKKFGSSDDKNVLKKWDAKGAMKKW
jgi:hypothetical protein